MHLSFGSFAAFEPLGNHASARAGLAMRLFGVRYMYPALHL